MMEGLDPKDCVTSKPNGWAVFKQPSGRSLNAENIENLPSGYYSTDGQSAEYIRTFIDGEYGLSLSGTPVYKEFRPDFHMAKGPLKAIMGRPIVVGMDLGLTPAAVLGQLDPRGRFLVLAEAVSFDMGVQRFTRTLLKPLLAELFPGFPVLVVTDPAGTQRAQTDEKSAVDIIRAERLTVIPARTNVVAARLNAVDDFLMRQIDGESAFLVDPRCSHLKAAMMGGYRYHPKTGNIEKTKLSHCFPAGTNVLTLAGEKPIEYVSVGDEVVTPFGPRKVAATMSRLARELVKVDLEDGTSLTCTLDHPIYTAGGIALSEALQYDSVLLGSGSPKCLEPKTQYRSSWASNTTGSRLGTISLPRADTCIEMFGRHWRGLYRTATTFTIKTTTGLITAWTTLSVSLRQSTLSTTLQIGHTPTPTGGRRASGARGTPPLSGAGTLQKPQRERRGFLKTEKLYGRTQSKKTTNVGNALRRFGEFLELTSKDIAAQRASQQRGETVASMTKQDSALYAKVVSELIATGKLKPAAKIARISFCQLQNAERVYDLTVEEVHSFFANGLWVSNCAEALQYLALHISAGGDIPTGPVRREVRVVSPVGWT